MRGGAGLAPAEPVGRRCAGGWIWRGLPRAKVIEFQARTQFDRFDPMEVIASPDETNHLLAENPQPLLLFPEDRLHPIRMQADLPLRWILSGPKREFAGEAQRNEYYAYQIGLYAPKQPVNTVKVGFSALRATDGSEIPASALTCFNTGGINNWGRPFTKVVDIPAGHVQALWMGVDIAKDQDPGAYSGLVTISADGIAPQTVAVRILVHPELIPERGDNEPWRYSRLRWLNSTLGTEDFVPAPYTPVKTDGQTIACLGRNVRLGADGLPSAINSGTHAVLAAPARFIVDGQDGPVPFQATGTKWLTKMNTRVEWENDAASAAGALICKGKMEYDGCLNIRMTLRANTDLDLRDIRLELPFRPESADYLIGAGLGYAELRPKDYDWKWGGPYNSFWMGSVHAGIHVKLLGATYTGPLLNLYHPAPPTTWGNSGKGGVSIRETAGGVLATAYSGPRKLKAGEETTYEFQLLITPVKPLDTEEQFKTRYCQINTKWTPNGMDPTPPEDALAAGVNVVNVHHATIFNPYINYPYIKNAELKQFADEMHQRHVKVKVYDTVREVSSMVTELWALRSLGDEIFAGGGGGGYAWCQEHLITGYAPAWFQRYSPDGPPDAAIVTSSNIDSRWQNYYVEGIGWLVRNIGIDGIYLDDVAYDRHILQRVRSVMDHEKPGCLIDLHSNTGFSVGPANQYAEFMPYLNRPWFGECFNYNAMKPEQWLVEVSGLPFGLMGDMLYRGGNPWRGAVYGMTTRFGWQTENAVLDPRPVWKIWDRFGIADSKMIGYWEPDCPVRTDNADVLATVYRKPGQSLIAVASWAPARTDVHLSINWETLGLQPGKVSMYAPQSAGFQKFQQWKPGDSISIDPSRGLLIIVDKTGPKPTDIATPNDVPPGLHVLLKEDFRAPLGADWKVNASRNPGTSLSVAGGALRIHAATNVTACADFKLPADTAAVDCSVDLGSDRGETWGPGLAMCWPGDKAVRICIRVPDGAFGIDATGREQQLHLGRLNTGDTVSLRIRFDADKIYAEARNAGEDWQTIAILPRREYPGQPVLARIGKSAPPPSLADHTDPGATGDCSYSSVRAYGP